MRDDERQGRAIPAGAAAPLALAPDTPSPSQQQPLQEAANGSVEEALARQMQASLRRLFPRLTTTLPPELDAGVEAELASDSDAESAGWTSSSEDEEEGSMAHG